MIQVNGTTIAEETILADMQYHPAETQREAMIKAGEALIIAELLKQRAVEIGIAVDSSSPVEEEAYLDTLLEKEAEIPDVKAEECQTYYENNQSKFCSAPLLAVRHILLEAAPDDVVLRDQARQKADGILVRLKQDMEDFAELAKDFSACPSGKLGGELGQVGPGQTVPEFERQLFACQPGLLESPLESRYGYHVVSIDHRVEGEQLPFEAVEEKITQYLSEKVRRKSIAQYIETLISQAEIEGFDFSVSDSPLMQ